MKRTTCPDKKLQILRKKAKNRYHCKYIIGGICCLAFIMFWIRYIEKPFEIVYVIILSAGLTIPVFITFSIIAYRAQRVFKNAYKDSCVLKAFQGTEYFEDLFYDRKKGFLFQEINETTIECGEKFLFNSRDKLIGRYQGIPFEAGSVHTKKLRTCGRSIYAKTLFDGQLFRFTTPCVSGESAGYLQIFQKEFQSDRKGQIAKYKILTDNISFNNRYDIYASDAFHSYYALTNQLMKKIQDFSDLTETQTAISFNGSTMYAAVDRKFNMFNPQINTPVEEQKQTIQNEIKTFQSACEIFQCFLSNNSVALKNRYNARN